MKHFKHEYKALDNWGGEYMRDAFTVGELPHHKRAAALKQAALKLGIQKIEFGVPIWDTIGMLKCDVAVDERRWLLYKGCDLPLMYVNAGG